MTPTQIDPDATSLWTHRFEAAVLTLAAAELAGKWDGSNDFPDDKFREDPSGTYIYDPEANEVQWAPSAKPWPPLAIDVMQYDLYSGRNSNDDGSTRTFEDELNWMNSGYFVWRDIIDIDAIQECIRSSAKDHPELIKPHVDIRHDMEAFCDLAQDGEFPMGMEPLAAWASQRWSGSGHTPLMAAARFGEIELAERLFAHSDPTARNKHGKSAFDIAVDERDETMAKLLSRFEQFHATRLAIESSTRMAASPAGKPKERSRTL